MNLANGRLNKMNAEKYKPDLAFKEHLLNGHAVSLIEAMLLFGVQSPNRSLTKFKREGYIIKSQRVPMAKIIRRINKYTMCAVPDDLPYAEISMMEYWVSK